MLRAAAPQSPKCLIAAHTLIPEFGSDLQKPIEESCQTWATGRHFQRQCGLDNPAAPPFLLCIFSGDDSGV